MNAQEFYSVSGKVLDASSKRQLSYASIQLISTNISNVTNSEGNFILKVPPSAPTETVFGDVIINPSVDVSFIVTLLFSDPATTDIVALLSL